MLRRQEVIGWFLLVSTLGLPLALLGADGDMQEPKASVAQLDVQPVRVEWLSRVGAERLILTVAGPGDFYSQREFGAGEFGHLEQIRDERLGEADRAGADDGDLKRHDVLQ